MTKKELKEKLDELYHLPNDEEEAHILADRALLDFINDPEVTKKFLRIYKWYA